MGGQPSSKHEEAIPLYIRQQGQRLGIAGAAFDGILLIHGNALRGIRRGVILAFVHSRVHAVVVVPALPVVVILLAVAISQGDGDFFAGLDLNGGGIRRNLRRTSAYIRSMPEIKSKSPACKIRLLDEHV